MAKINHSNCDHPRTPAGRKACRRGKGQTSAPRTRAPRAPKHRPRRGHTSAPDSTAWQTFVSDDLADGPLLSCGHIAAKSPFTKIGQMVLCYHPDCNDSRPIMRG